MIDSDSPPTDSDGEEGLAMLIHGSYEHLCTDSNNCRRIASALFQRYPGMEW